MPRRPAMRPPQRRLKSDDARREGWVFVVAVIAALGTAVIVQEQPRVADEVSALALNAPVELARALDLDVAPWDSGDAAAADPLSRGVAPGCSSPESARADPRRCVPR